MKIGRISEIPVETNKRKLADAGINPTDTESKSKNSMRTHESKPKLNDINSILDPVNAVYEWDTMLEN